MSRPDGYLVPDTLDAEAILSEVARGFRVSVEEIVGPSRAARVCVARACAMAVVREATDLSLPAIGRLFDRDHTTVMHHHQRVMADRALRRGVELVLEELRPAPQLFSVEGGTG